MMVTSWPSASRSTAIERPTLPPPAMTTYTLRASCSRALHDRVGHHVTQVPVRTAADRGHHQVALLQAVVELGDPHPRAALHGPHAHVAAALQLRDRHAVAVAAHRHLDDLDVALLEGHVL